MSALSPAATISRPPPRSIAAATDTTPLLDLATSPPALCSSLVARPALVRCLVEASQAALAVIVAPPGYGKSTLLAEWAEHDPRPFVWLGLGEHEPGTVSALMGLPPWGASDGLARLVRRTRARHAEFVVVLDDAQVVEPGVLREVVEAALHELPAGSTVALASRTEPAVPVGRLRAHRRLCEIRLPQLAMDPAEAGALLRKQGLELEAGQVQDLVRRTEGWPAALYLAALALHEDPDGLTCFGGRHHLISEYLRDEVAGLLPPDVVRFSIETSVLDELSGPVCDVVLERRGSALVLQQLARQNPLLMPVDPAHQSYRWHTLMREALAGDLRRIEPEREAPLRLRASHWYSGRGDSKRAIDQAAGARDAKLTGDLLWPNVLAYVGRGRNNLVRHWLRNFCDDEISASAPLALSASLSALVAGDADAAQRWSLIAADGLKREVDGPEPQSLTTALAVVEAMSAHDGVGRMRETALSAYQTEPEQSPWRPVYLLLAGVAAHLQDDRAASEHFLDESAGLSGIGAPGVTALALAQRAVLAMELEDWELGGELTDRATAFLEGSALKTDPLSALVFAAAAASRAHDGRVDEAKNDLQTGIDLLAAAGDFVPWYDAEARILLAQASLWLADVVGARTLLAQASRFARRTRGATVFQKRFDQAWAYLDTVAETRLAGPSSLTIAELRILRFLPSHRSFREIGAQLGVSANTVKTQAHAVYRKLGAASRSEAVAHAMDAGLLGQ